MEEEKNFSATTESEARELANAWVVAHPEYFVVSMTPFTVGHSDGRSASGNVASCRVTVRYKKTPT